MGNSSADLEIGGINPDFDGIGARLAEKRNALGWSLEKAAAMSGVSVSTINRLELGQIKAPTAASVVMLCKAYGCSLDALFALDIPESPDKEPTHTAFLEAENAELKESLRRERKKRSLLTVCFVVLALMITAWFVLIDGPNGNFGLIRYVTAFGGTGSIPAWVGMLGAMI